MEFAWVPLLALMPLFLPDATAFSRSMMIGKLSFLTVWTLAYWLSKKLPKSLLPNCNSISHLRLFSRMYRQYPGDHQLLKGLQTLSRLSFCNNHGMHPCIKFINKARTEKPSREIKMRLGREQNPFLVQTNTGEGSNWKISHHSSKYTLVCHVEEDCRKLVKNPEIHWHNLRFSILELAVDSFSGFLITSSGCLDFKLLVYIFQGRPSLKD